MPAWRAISTGSVCDPRRSKNRSVSSAVRGDRGLDGLDLAGDDQAVLLEADLELLASRGDPALALELDPLDLAVGPGVDALDVLLGELAQLLGLERLTGADGVEVGLAPLVGELRVARLLGGCGRPHRLGKVVEERQILARPVG